MCDKKKKLLDRLTKEAQFKGGGFWSNVTAQDYVRTGKKIPDNSMPGTMIKNLSEEDRKILETCTEDDFKSINWRPEDYKNYGKEMERKKCQINN